MFAPNTMPKSNGHSMAGLELQDIGYITDIEGDLDTFNRYVDSDASVLRREDGVLKLTLRLPKVFELFMVTWWIVWILVDI